MQAGQQLPKWPQRSSAPDAAQLLCWLGPLLAIAWAIAPGLAVAPVLRVSILHCDRHP